MSDNEKKSNQKQANASTEDVGQDEAQRLADEATEKGYVGNVPDPTPNENYTVLGVVKGLPTPETDDDARVAARKEAGFR